MNFKEDFHYVYNINRNWSWYRSIIRCWSWYYAIGLATSKAADAIARQPEADSKITKALLLGAALAEATAIYGFVIAFLILILLK